MWLPILPHQGRNSIQPVHVISDLWMPDKSEDDKLGDMGTSQMGHGLMKNQCI